ncbi:hypothetical protein QBC46DRAFT_414318 [Diplogelasinospora grovesii]|uniref:Uncharacterized protein n=1 Tax=Diplogelasinospora grovesii TaxID=303347 RepID=A0AAN6RYZ0_9PEZI|nr:hypothetical protein QBC46DRAFT_414318 [Diplogelasinospora grovesii]
MDTNIFPTAFNTCESRSEQADSWCNQFDNTISVSTGYVDSLYGSASEVPSYTPSGTLLTPSTLSLDFHPNSSSLPSTLGTIPLESLSNPPSWTQRLENLERALERLQDPTELHQPYLACSRLKELEILLNDIQSNIKTLQGAVSGLEDWAQRMNSVYREFKGTIWEVGRLVNSPQHMRNILNNASP